MKPRPLQTDGNLDVPRAGSGQKSRDRCGAERLPLCDGGVPGDAMPCVAGNPPSLLCPLDHVPLQQTIPMNRDVLI
jgi:hypothetical protein